MVKLLLPYYTIMYKIDFKILKNNILFFNKFYKKKSI